MKNLKKTICILILVLFVFQANVYLQKSDKFLDREIKMNLSKTNLINVVNKLAYEHAIPVGLELDLNYRLNDSDKAVIDKKELKWLDEMEIKEGSLLEILDSIVKQNPQYKWKVEEGVINIFPIKDRDKVLKKLLDLKVIVISLKKNFDKSELVKTLSNSYEFQTLLIEEKVEITKNNLLNQVHNRSKMVNQDFHIENTSVKKALNTFVRDSSYKLWVIERIGKKKKRLSINF